jgi:hypothetical protein
LHLLVNDGPTREGMSFFLQVQSILMQKELLPERNQMVRSRIVVGDYVTVPAYHVFQSEEHKAPALLPNIRASGATEWHG